MKSNFSIKMMVQTLWTDFYGWSVKEYAWLVLASLAIIVTSLVMGGGMIELISSLTGIVGAILVAKGKISSYAWGVVATALYAWVSYGYQLYGETILYTLVFLPMQFIGYYYWIKSSSQVGDAIVDVIKRALSTRQRLFTVGATIVAIVGYAAFLRVLEGAMPGMDAATAILSVTATLLMVRRFAEQWIAWIVVNVVAVTMWVVMVLQHQDQGWAVLAMWIVFLLNSIYGWVQWRTAKVEG